MIYKLASTNVAVAIQEWLMPLLRQSQNMQSLSFIISLYFFVICLFLNKSRKAEADTNIKNM